MSASAGYTAEASVSATAGGAGSYTKVAYIDSATLKFARALLEVTNLKDAASNPDAARIYGLRDMDVTLSGKYDQGDTDGQQAVQAAQLAGSELWVKVLPDGTHGVKFQCLVESIDMDASVGGVAGWKASLKKTGAATTI